MLAPATLWHSIDGTGVRRRGYTGPPPNQAVARAGALPLGQADYPIPGSNVIYLSTTGSDSNNGLTVGAPKATLQAAVTACPAGGTIVARGGVYEQRYTGDQTKPLTIQAYPGETVWFDGSKQRSTWTNNGNGTWTAQLFAQFDHTTPTGYSGGINAAHPMAVWPDFVIVDGTRLTHRPNTETPTAGQFTLDYTAGTVTIGTDPTGKEVRLPALELFMVVKATCTLRGIGIRRYATPINFSAACLNIVSAGAGTVIENVVLEDAGQQPLSVKAANVTVSQVTVRRGANIGIHADSATGYLFDRVLVDTCNFNRWNDQPSAGGIKWSESSGTIRDTIVRDTYGTAIWWDVACANNVGFNLYLTDNTGPAIEHEISTNLLLVNCRAPRVGTSGFWALSAAGTRIWNCDVGRASAFDLRFEEDSRQAAMEDPQHPYNDGIQNWQTVNTEVCNTVLSNAAGAGGVWRLYFNDIFEAGDASGMIERVGGNVWSSPTAGTASRMAAVENAAGSVQTYTTPAAFAAAMPAGKVGTNTVLAANVPTQNQLDALSSTAEPLPADVAALLGLPEGAQVVGPVLPAPIARAS